MRRLRHTLLAIALVLGALSLPAPAAAATADVCPVGCPFARITEAVAYAAPGDVITIGPGIYLETIVIDKPLTLKGADAGLPAWEQDRTGSLVVPAGAAGFVIEAAGVTIDGFRIQPSSGPNKTGIVGNDTLRVLNTLFAGNTAGVVDFGPNTEVRGNLFEHNNLAGPRSGTALATDRPASGLLVVNNRFIGNDGPAVQLGAGPHSEVAVTFNRLQDTGGFHLADASDVMLWGNALNATRGDGIALRGGVAGIYLRENQVVGAEGAAMRITSDAGLGPNVAVMLDTNRFIESAVGIQADAGALMNDATLTGNVLRDNLVQALDPDGRLGLGASLSTNLMHPAVLLEHGDGSPTTLVHTQIQPVLDMAVAGDTLVLSAGEFNEPITLSERIGVRGAGSGANAARDTILRMLEPNTPGLTFLAGGDSPTQRLVVQGLRIVGAHGSSGNTGSGILVASGVAHVTLDDVASVGNTGSGLAIATTSEVVDFRISNATLNENGNAGLRVASSLARLDGLSLVDSDVSRNALHGILVLAEGGDFTNVTLERSSIHQNAMDQPVSVGRGGVSLYGFNGRAVLRELSVYSLRSDFGVQLHGVPEGAAPELILERNTFGGKPVRNAVVLQEYTNASGIVLRGNAFHVGDRAGLAIYDFGNNTTVDARYNYWGAATGPVYDPMRMVPELPVRGAGIVAYPEQVAFAPWCAVPSCTDANVVEPLTRDVMVTLPPLREPEQPDPEGLVAPPEA